MSLQPQENHPLAVLDRLSSGIRGAVLPLKPVMEKQQNDAGGIGENAAADRALPAGHKLKTFKALGN